MLLGRSCIALFATMSSEWQTQRISCRFGCICLSRVNTEWCFPTITLAPSVAMPIMFLICRPFWDIKATTVSDMPLASASLSSTSPRYVLTNLLCFFEWYFTHTEKFVHGYVSAFVEIQGIWRLTDILHKFFSEVQRENRFDNGCALCPVHLECSHLVFQNV